MVLTEQLTSPIENKLVASEPPIISIHRRKHVRIFYGADWPEEYKPELFIKCRGYQILDISASGIQFIIPSMSLCGEFIISGVVRFPENHIVSFSGEVVRYESEQIAIKLFNELPNNTIMRELSRLRDLEKKGLISDFLL
jgi:hypothetical protein